MILKIEKELKKKSLVANFDLNRPETINNFCLFQ